MGSRLTTLFAGVAMAFTLSALLQAHLAVEKSEPANGAVLTAPPPHVQLFLTEEPDAKVSKLEIRGASTKVKLVEMHAMGKSLMASLQGDMTDGKYTVLWQAAGDDGHVQKGEFSFTLKRK